MWLSQNGRWRRICSYSAPAEPEKADATGPQPHGADTNREQELTAPNNQQWHSTSFGNQSFQEESTSSFLTNINLTKSMLHDLSAFESSIPGSPLADEDEPPNKILPTMVPDMIIPGDDVLKSNTQSPRSSPFAQEPAPPLPPTLSDSRETAPSSAKVSSHKTAINNYTTSSYSRH
ncbi:hypothetical protein CYMTET_28888 [Cymbomonas tetramitiformis]|uniref:Uncharacterized protein n=1 Tax=Cymbomonas tetramitiformis TaxID=36881 RepID=A0AAE0FMM4_9CHLO|nr:hypothetical protein CYMTET_28888 [Cymbomonas tetramitiformis]